MNDIIVHVRYYNVLADYAGCKRTDVSLAAGCTVRQLLDRLVEVNSASFRRAVKTGDSFNPYLRIFCNDRLLSEQELDGPAIDGDEILLFPAVAGGYSEARRGDG